MQTTKTNYMYKEEKVINGVLCHRGTPDGEWSQFTIEQLTVKYKKLESILNGIEGRIDDLTDITEKGNEKRRDLLKHLGYHR